MIVTVTVLACFVTERNSAYTHTHSTLPHTVTNTWISVGLGGRKTVSVTWWEGQGLGVLGRGIGTEREGGLQGSGGDRVKISCVICTEHRLLLFLLLWRSKEEE